MIDLMKNKKQSGTKTDEQTEKRSNEKMKILVISDTHGREENMHQVLKKTGRPDLILHLGDSEGGEDIIRQIADCPMHLVAGNCDFFCRYPKDKIVEVAGVRIFMTHGHYYYVNMGTNELTAAAIRNRCQIALFGHTHVPLLDQRIPGLTILNPGSLSKPRQEGHRPSYALLELEDGKLINASLHVL